MCAYKYVVNFYNKRHEKTVKLKSIFFYIKIVFYYCIGPISVVLKVLNKNDRRFSAKDKKLFSTFAKLIEVHFINVLPSIY